MREATRSGHGSVRRIVLIALAGLPLVGCGDDPLVPTLDLTVEVVTTGAAYDPDGYVLTTGNERSSRRLDLGDEGTISLLGETATVELTDVASNCTVEDGTRRSVVDQGDGATVSFHVRCVAPADLASSSIVFVRMAEGNWFDAGDLYEVSLGGGNPVRRTFDDGKLGPTVTADGARMAFLSLPPDFSPCEIQVAAMDGTPVTSVPDCGWDPSWSPDATRIAYSIGDPWFETRLRIWDLESEALFELPSRDIDHQPAWSPDGEWIAFARASAGSPGIHLTTPDGTEVLPLTTGGSNPVWSPSGRRIAYVREADVRLVDLADGSSVEFLTRRNFGQWEPTDWSADGKWIALTERRYQRTEADVYMARVTDRRLFRVTTDGLSHSAAFRDGAQEEG